MFKWEANSFQDIGYFRCSLRISSQLITNLEIDQKYYFPIILGNNIATFGKKIKESKTIICITKNGKIDR